MLPRSAFRLFAILSFAAAFALLAPETQAYQSPGPDLGSSCAWEGADPTRAGFFATCVSSVVVARPLQAGNQTAACDTTTAGQIKYSSGSLSFCNGSAWTSVSSGGSSQWSNGASSAIYYNSGNVGIGTAAPAQKLSVAGTIESTSGGVKFPDGTTQTTAAAASASPIKAWVNFDGTSCSPACTIRASSNVSSVNRDGTGAYTIYFTSALSDANYATIATCGTGARGVSDPSGYVRIYQGSTTSQIIGTINGNGSAWMDMQYVSVQVLR